MTKQIKTVLLASTAVALAASAQAQYTANNNDLLLGFTTPSSTGDLVIDLGVASSITSQSFLDLNLSGNVGLSASALQSQLNTLYGSMNSLQFGVVGGHYTSGLNSAVYSTVAQGAAAPALGNQSVLMSAINTAGQGLNDFIGSPSNQGVVDPTQNYGESWTEQVGPGTLSSSFGQRGYNPNSATPASFTTSLVEDLYVTTPTSEQLLGTITLFSSGDVQWNAAPVPEPTAYSLMGGLGILAALFRRRFNRK